MKLDINNLSARQIRALKALIFVIALLPLVRLIWFGFTDQLGANPVEFMTRSTGTWTLVFLCITLTITPLRKISGWNVLLRLRRMFGLFVFFYALLHFTTYIWLDQWFDLAAVWKDVLKRPFITVGFTAFLLLWPLALTSTNAMVKRLGGKRWQALHRLIYGVAVLGVTHYWWHKAGKNDLAQPLIYAAVVAVLLGYRLYALLSQRVTLALNRTIN